jgi:hypothetical protein
MENGNYHRHVLVYLKKQEQLDIQRDPAHCGCLSGDVQKRNESFCHRVKPEISDTIRSWIQHSVS